jgi:uncharacterized protein (DUF4415 family)
MGNETTAKARRPKPPANYDENPVWTAEDFARARPASEVFGTKFTDALVRKPGRPVGSTKPNAKKSLSLRLDPDVIDGWRASGPGWQRRMNDALRAALKTRPA